LLAYGGIRISEALNLFVDDIKIDDAGQAVVLLKHPVKGKDTRYLNGACVTETRQEFLSRYGLIPRNMLGQANPLHSGWKGILYDNQAERCSMVHWVTPEFSRKFAQLHMEYMHYRIKAGNKHPYYFISIKGKDFGNPLKMGNVRLQFSQLCKKLHIAPQNGAGHLHSLRHFYKWASESLGGISIVDQRVRMHHKSLQSTESYGAPTVEEMHKRLEGAYRKIEETLL